MAAIAKATLKDFRGRIEIMWVLRGTLTIFLGRTGSTGKEFFCQWAPQIGEGLGSPLPESGAVPHNDRFNSSKALILAKLAPTQSIYRQPGFLLFWISGILFTICYLIATLNLTEEFVYVLEVKLFGAARATFGRTIGWDLFFTLAGSKWTYFLAVAVGIGGWILEGWYRRHEDYGRVYGFVLMSVIGVIGIHQLCDFVSDSVERPAPWTILGKAPISRDISKDLVDDWKDSGVPEENLVTFMFLLVIYHRRLPRTWMAGLALAVTYTAGQVLMGYQWAGTMMISALLGLMSGGLWVFALQRPLQWAERKSEDAFVALFWRHFQRGDFGILAADRRSVRTHSKARVKSQEALWHKMIERRVLPMLAPGVEEYKLSKKPPVIGDTPSRASRYVRFLMLPVGEVLVVKLARRLRGIITVPRRIRGYEESARASVLLERLGIPVPRTYWVESHPPKTFGLWHLFLSVEEFLVGRPLAKEDTAEVATAMRLLVRLHGHVSDKWGSITDDKPRSLSLYLLQHVRPEANFFLERISRIAGGHGLPREIKDWVLQEMETDFLGLVRRRPHLAFRLMHGDVTFRNFLFDAEGSPHLIDFVTVRYDLFAKEIIKSAICLTEGGPEAASKAWVAYFESADAERWEEFKDQGTIGLRMYAMRECAHERVRLSDSEDSTERIESAVLWLQNLFAVDSSVWGNTAAETDWARIMALLSNETAKTD